MGDQRVSWPTDKERQHLWADHILNLEAAATTTNEDLSWSNDHPLRYRLDRAQIETLLVHGRQDTAVAHLQTVTIRKAVALNETLLRRIQLGVLVVIALQVAQLSGCHWG